jgi:hypothetical protein
VCVCVCAHARGGLLLIFSEAILAVYSLICVSSTL